MAKGDTAEIRSRLGHPIVYQDSQEGTPGINYKVHSLEAYLVRTLILYEKLYKPYTVLLRRLRIASIIVQGIGSLPPLQYAEELTYCKGLT